MEKKSDLFKSLDQFHQASIMCIGDVMLDRFNYGYVKRISPEAPIPVMKLDSMHEMIGGAGNVLSNLLSLGMKAHLISVVGQDAVGQKISEIIEEKSGELSFLLTDPTRISTLKKRFISNNQHLLRVDEEDDHFLSDLLCQNLLNYLKGCIKEIDLIILSDYNKGALPPSLCQKIIDLAHKNHITVLVDPKGKDFNKYKNADIITPNFLELASVSPHDLKTDEDVLDALRYLKEKHCFKNVIVTRGEKGFSLISDQNETLSEKAKAREVFDVSGAGDTFVSTLGACLSVNLSFEDAAKIANIASGLAVEKLGTATVTFNELLEAIIGSRSAAHTDKVMSLKKAKDQTILWKQRGFKVGFTNGCFDLLHPGHIRIIHEARQKCDKLILGLNNDASIKRLKGESRPIQNEKARACVLSALSDIDAVVVFEEDTPLNLIQSLNPNVLIKGADYQLHEVVGADFILKNKGEVHLVPLEQNQSTTSVIKKIKINQ